LLAAGVAGIAFPRQQIDSRLPQRGDGRAQCVREHGIAGSPRQRQQRARMGTQRGMCLAASARAPIGLGQQARALKLLAQAQVRTHAAQQVRRTLELPGVQGEFGANQPARVAIGIVARCGHGCSGQRIAGSVNATRLQQQTGLEQLRGCHLLWHAQFLKRGQ